MNGLILCNYFFKFKLFIYQSLYCQVISSERGYNFFKGSGCSYRKEEGKSKEEEREERLASASLLCCFFDLFISEICLLFFSDDLLYR